jgi:histidinol-phosphatase
MEEGEIERAMDTARRAVLAAAEASRRHWRTELRVEIKPDRTPVTAADRECEAAILSVIRAAFPDHSILSEETGAIAGAADSRWIVDPLDGTRGFARGGSFWGPIVGFQHRGEILAGAMALPVLEQAYWAGRGLGAYRDGTRLRVSGVAAWDDATFAVGELKALLSGPWRKGISALIASAASTRSYGDVAGCAQLLDGRAEAWIESGVKPWDLAGLGILVEEAGGRFVDPGGGDPLQTGRAVATNGVVHDHVIRALGAA